MTIETGKDLFTIINEGRVAAFTQFYEFFFQRLLLTADKYVKDVFVAEEIVQNVFLKIWESPSDLEEIQKLKPYLYKSVINLSINHVNRQKTIEFHHNKILSDATTIDVTDLDDDNELIILLHQEIEKLPVQCRKVFKMSRFERLKYKEIAELLSLSERTVENHIGAALKQLRKTMHEKRPGFENSKKGMIIRMLFM